ncbi:MAG TPA: response regulator transcription factor [Anaerolineales bacterium]|nr:response regulator transcription factor [Anaerolineales bacterium]
MTVPTRVLVIDDDVTLANLLCMLLEKDGFGAIAATSGAEGLRLARQENPDGIILDVMMPGIHGYEVCRRLRKITDAAIVFVSVKGTTEDIVRGLHLGADDYVVKPYTYEELSSRLLACLRRRNAGSLPPVYRASREVMLVTDPDRRLVFINNHETQLTPTEFQVLKYLLKNQGKVLSTDAILANAWGPEYIGERELVKQFIYRLRAKLEQDPSTPKYIQTVRGAGYVFEANGLLDD